MPNPIPVKYKNEVYRRSDYKCEICRGIQLTPPHHIVVRSHRNHRPDNLISVCINCHAMLENERGKDKLNYQLRLALQQYYDKYYDEGKVYTLMGGRRWLGELESRTAINHFMKIDSIYQGRDFE